MPARRAAKLPSTFIEPLLLSEQEKPSQGNDCGHEIPSESALGKANEINGPIGRIRLGNKQCRLAQRSNAQIGSLLGDRLCRGGDNNWHDFSCSLKGDKRAIFTASTAAHAAVDFLGSF